MLVRCFFFFFQKFLHVNIAFSSIKGTQCGGRAYMGMGLDGCGCECVWGELWMLDVDGWVVVFVGVSVFG